MSKKDRITNIINKAVQGSFTQNRLDSAKVNKFVKIFSSGSSIQAVLLLKQYQKSLENYLKEHTLIIESATGLDKSTLNQIIQKMSQQRLILNSTFQLNPSLLGGIRLTIGNDVFDQSVVYKISQLGQAVTGG